MKDYYPLMFFVVGFLSIIIFIGILLVVFVSLYF